MKFTGYMIEGSFDGDTLVVRGKNKAARIALAGAEHGAGDVEIPKASIAAIDSKPPSALVNGKVVVTTVEGRKVQLHFRRKQRADWTELDRVLRA